MQALADHLPRQAGWWVLGFSALACVLLAGVSGVWALGLAVLGFAWLRQVMMRRLGGTTGDTAGAMLELLEVLMRASPGAVTRQQLEFALWGDEPPDGDLLRSHVYELRRSVDGPFADKLIHTLPRVGYRLASAAGADARNDDDGA